MLFSWTYQVTTAIGVQTIQKGNFCAFMLIAITSSSCCTGTWYCWGDWLDIKDAFSSVLFIVSNITKERRMLVKVDRYEFLSIDSWNSFLTFILINNFLLKAFRFQWKINKISKVMGSENQKRKLSYYLVNSSKHPENTSCWAWYDIFLIPSLPLILKSFYVLLTMFNLKLSIWSA